TRAALTVMRSEEGAPDRIATLVDTLHALAHSVNDQLQAEGDPHHLHLPVCCADCGFCCHADVLLSPPELLRIVRHLRATLSAEEVAGLASSARELAAQTREMSEREWRRARLACPLYDSATSSCTVYEARPAACRAYNSLELSKCHERYDT